MSTIGALGSIGRPITRSEDLFVYLIVERLNPRSCREWENDISDSAEPPSYAALQQFLEKRLHTLESLQLVKSDTEPSKSSSSRQLCLLHARKQDSKHGKCSLCQKDHILMLCDAYKAKSADDRKKYVESNGQCLGQLPREPSFERVRFNKNLLRVRIASPHVVTRCLSKSRTGRDFSHGWASALQTCNRAARHRLSSRIRSFL
jgi:hypothetical protein